jgi:hypothetical protein
MEGGDQFTLKAQLPKNGRKFQMPFLGILQKISHFSSQITKKSYTSPWILAGKRQLKSDMYVRAIGFVSQAYMSDKQAKLGMARRFLHEWLSLKINYQWVYNVNRVLFEIFGFLAMLAGPIFFACHYKEIPENSLKMTALFSILCGSLYIYFATKKRKAFQKFLRTTDAAETLKYHANDGEFFGFASVLVVTITILNPIYVFFQASHRVEVLILVICSYLGIIGSFANHFIHVNVNSIISMSFSFFQQRVADGSTNLLILSSQSIERIRTLNINPLSTSKISEKLRRDLVDSLRDISNALRSHVFPEHSKERRNCFHSCSEKAFELSERMQSEFGNSSVRSETADYLINLCNLTLERNLGCFEVVEKKTNKPNISPFSFPLLINSVLALVPSAIILIFFQSSELHKLLSSSPLLFLMLAFLLAFVVLIVPIISMMLTAVKPQDFHYGDKYYVRDSEVRALGRGSKSVEVDRPS